jgi:hypothetical protein
MEEREFGRQALQKARLEPASHGKGAMLPGLIEQLVEDM